MERNDERIELCEDISSEIGRSRELEKEQYEIIIIERDTYGLAEGTDELVRRNGGGIDRAGEVTSGITARGLGVDSVIPNK